VTVVTCMSLIGPFIPPLLVFPRKNFKEELMSGSPPGSSHACHPSGWIQSEIFFPVVSSFQQTYKADKRRSCYLSTGRALFRHQEPGGHYLPPYSSHKKQPLDKAFMGPMKIFCCQEIEKWLRSHPGRFVAIYQTGELFDNAYERAATGEIAVNGFRATGLFPCDKNIFRPYDFPLSSEGKCCSCEPSCFDKDQRSAIIQFC